MTRSGANQFRGSGYYWWRDNGLVGTEAKGLTYNPGTFDYKPLRRLALGPDRQGQALLLPQLRERQVHPARHDVPREHRVGDGGWQRDARPRLRPRRPELLPQPELQVRHRPLPGLPVRDPGEALPGEGRLQPERPQQGQLPLPAARLGDPGAPLELELARPRHAPHQHHRAQFRELQLRDPREHQVGRRRVELDPQQQQVQLADRGLHHERREPPAERDSLPLRGHPEGQHGLHLLRIRALHPEQRAPVQHVPGPGQLHLEPREPHLHVRGDGGEVPLRQRVLPRRAERLRLQLARRLLHRRQRLPGQPEPDDLPGQPGAVPGPLQQHPGAGPSPCSRSTCGTAASTPRTSGRPPATSR